jgi:hypothetical protein
MELLQRGVFAQNVVIRDIKETINLSSPASHCARNSQRSSPYLRNEGEQGGGGRAERMFDNC